MSESPKGMAKGSWPLQDHELWRAAFEDDGLFAGGPASHWAEGSRGSVGASYGRWLGFLRDNAPEALSLPVAERVDRPRVKQYVQLLQTQVGALTTAVYIKHLFLALRAMCPEADLEWLRIVGRDLARPGRPRSKMDRFVPVSTILNLSERLMSRSYTSVSEAVDFRDGLILGLLAYRPLRRRNMSSIEIGTHLVRVGSGFVLRFGSEETKNRRALTVAIPAVLVPRLDEYIDRVRPLFGNCATTALWLSRTGHPLTAAGFHAAVAKRTKAEFGRAISPHLFRTIAADTVVSARPADVYVAAGVLGHAPGERNVDLYLLARSIEASQAHDELIESLRSEALKKGAR
jgi:integrase